jgi:hypothetical protein
MASTLLRLLARSRSDHPVLQRSQRPVECDDGWSSAGFHASSRDLAEGLDVQEVDTGELPLDLWLGAFMAATAAAPRHVLNA